MDILHIYNNSMHGLSNQCPLCSLLYLFRSGDCIAYLLGKVTVVWIKELWWCTNILYIL